MSHSGLFRAGKRMGADKESSGFSSAAPDVFLQVAYDGSLDASRVGKDSSRFHEGDICEVEGYAGSYRGRVQITVSGIKATRKEVDPSIFLESAPGEPSEMMKSLRVILKEVTNAHLKRLIERFLGDQQFVSLFKRAPAAKNFHHNYLGGLLEHTLSVCQMARKVVEQKIY